MNQNGHQKSKMIPSYGQSLVNDIGLMRIRKQTSKDLELNYYENK